MITRIFKDERHTINGKLVIHNVLDVEVLLNSTLAGGVAMGAAADIIVEPYYAMICGWVTGAVSALGYIYIGPFLKEKINLHDTCGIHNLHAMPGFIGGIIAVICCNKQALVSYGSRYGETFQRYTEGRTPTEQAGYQLAGVFVTLGLAIVTGLFAGFIASRPFFEPPTILFDDRDNYADAKFPQINKNHLRFDKNNCGAGEEKSVVKDVF
jgi:ammonium transporter Rh